MSPPPVSWKLLHPVDLAWVLAAATLGYFAYRLYRGRSRGPEPGSGVLLLLRSLTIVVVLLLLLEPVLSFFSERSVPARIAVLFDGSLSMSVPWIVGDEADPPSRAGRVADAFTSEGGNLLARLRRKGRVESYRFGASLEALPKEPTAADLAPRDDRTDLASALMEGVGTRRRETGAVVLVSDGGQNVGLDAREEAGRLGVPVYAIGVGVAGAITDLSVFDVEASGVAWLDNEVPVRARVRARGEPIGDVTVYLSEGEAVLDSARVSLPGAGVEREVELRYVPATEGHHRYRVWVPARDEEISAANNEHPFAVRVLKEKIRALLVAGRPSFDLTFLNRALAADVSLDVERVVLSLQGFPGELGRGGASFPDGWSELALYDLVILLDVRSEDLSPARADALARFVTERGGALLVMGEESSFETRSVALADVLPVTTGKGPRRRTGQILPGLTTAGRDHPVTRMENDPEASERQWRELPPLASAPVFLQRKPRTRVLVQGILDGIPRPELPLVTVSEAGAGRVLGVAGSPYWRWDLRLWGSGRSGDLFRRFVSRSVRWLVSRDELRRIAIRPGKPLFDGAEDVLLEGQILDDDFRPVEGVDVRATVRGPRGAEIEKTREITLVDLGEGRYRAALAGLPPGDYVVEGHARLAGNDLGSDRAEMSVAPYRMEFENPAPDFELLRRIARESGGRFFTLEEAAALPDLLQLDPVAERSGREWPWLGSPAVLVLLLGLLGAEWALRRRRGMP